MLLQRDKIVSDESRFAPSERSGARQKGIAPRGDPKLKPWSSSTQRPKTKYRDLSTAQRTIRPSVATVELPLVLPLMLPAFRAPTQHKPDLLHYVGLCYRPLRI